MKKILTGICLFAALSLTACQSTDGDGQSAAAVNTKCPISGEAVNADSPTVDMNGQKVAFCCNNCAGRWDGMSDADKQAKLAESK